MSELVRQRALVSEHLAWLDREIARENNGAALPSAPALPLPLVPPAPPSAPDPIPVATAKDRPAIPAAVLASTDSPPLPATGGADELLEQYRVSPANVHQDVRKGCLLYFAGAFVLLGIVIAVLYFTISSR